MFKSLFIFFSLITCSLFGEILNYKINEPVSYQYSIKIEQVDSVGLLVSLGYQGEMGFDLKLLSTEDQKFVVEVIFNYVKFNTKLSLNNIPYEVDFDSRLKSKKFPKYAKLYQNIINQPLRFTIDGDQIVETTGKLSAFQQKLEDLLDSDDKYELLENLLLTSGTLEHILGQIFYLNSEELELGKEYPFAWMNEIDKLGNDLDSETSLYEGLLDDRSYYVINHIDSDVIKAQLNCSAVFTGDSTDAEDYISKISMDGTGNIIWEQDNALKQTRKTVANIEILGADDALDFHHKVKYSEALDYIGVKN